MEEVDDVMTFSLVPTVPFSLFVAFLPYTDAEGRFREYCPLFVGTNKRRGTIRGRK